MFRHISAEQDDHPPPNAGLHSCPRHLPLSVDLLTCDRTTELPRASQACRFRLEILQSLSQSLEFVTDNSFVELQNVSQTERSSSDNMILTTFNGSRIKSTKILAIHFWQGNISLSVRPEIGKRPNEILFTNGLRSKNVL